MTHQELVLKTLYEARGDELERFDVAAKMHTEKWWDSPASWNPAMTPREYREQLVDRRQRIDSAIAWVRRATHD